MIIALFALILLSPAQAVSAPAPQPEVKTPDDPRQRIELAEKVNGLRGMEIPWHLKATYQIYAADGSTSDEGTYEEWRGSAKQYRVALHSPTLNVEEYGTGQGVFRTGQRDWPREPLSSITSIIAGPTFPHISGDTVLENYKQSFGGKSLPCTAFMKRDSQITRKNAPSYCFSNTDAVLAYASSANATNQMVFEHIRSLRGHYLAYDMKQYLETRPWLKLHVDTLEGLGRAGFAAFTVPADAFPVTPRVRLMEQAPDRLISKVDPKYPLTARFQGFQGTVVLNALIDKEGHVTWLRALAGPVPLQQPSLDAVRQWVYQPYLVDGQPVEVETEINLIFDRRTHQVVH
jgi:TonB family protein